MGSLTFWENYILGDEIHQNKNDTSVDKINQIFSLNMLVWKTLKNGDTMSSLEDYSC